MLAQTSDLVTVAGAPHPPAGDVASEGITFIPWWQSPTLRVLLVVSNEVTGTTTVYELHAFPF